MLTNSFIHIDGIGEIIERRIWAEGAQSWLDFMSHPPKFLSYPTVKHIYKELEKSMQALEEETVVPAQIIMATSASRARSRMSGISARWYSSR